ncbi:MAG: NAD(P)H-quinone oxidoreductase [Porticoccaceae bacterium]
MNSQPHSAACIEISAVGGPDVLRPGFRDLPALASRQVLIAVSHAGVNRPDIFQREGKYPPPPGASDIPGLEVAGIVVAKGAQVTRWQVGDRVCALLPGGGYATHAVAEESLCLPVPKGLSLAEAAGLPETAFTVWHNLVERAALQAGEHVLIHGGSSGIGTLAIQIAAALGATVYTTAGSAEKCQVCEELGATKAFNYRSEDFAAVKELTGKRGVDIVLDMVGGDYVQKNIACAAPGGRIVSIAFLQGSRVNVDLMPMMLKQLTLTGSTLRSRTVENKAHIAAQVETNLWPLIDAGVVRPLIHRIFPLPEAADAHRLMESSQHIGKLVLDCTAVWEAVGDEE